MDIIRCDAIRDPGVFTLTVPLRKVVVCIPEFDGDNLTWTEQT